MSQRVVMHLTKWTQNVQTFQEFLTAAVELGAGPRAKVVFAHDSDGHPCFYVDLPDGASDALEKRRKPKEPTKAQKAVKSQLEDRKRAVQDGKEVPGHVRPVVRGGKVLKVKVKKQAASGL